jgi:hypothetical protein
MLYDKIIFVHIPKNGGSSIRKILYKYVLCIDHNIDFKKFDKSYYKIIILRDPISRFISAVNWTVNKYKQNKIGYINMKLLDNHFISPDNWASAFFDKNHLYHIDVVESISTIKVSNSSKNHMINNKRLNNRWQFSYQNLWYMEPCFVLLFDNLDQEIRYFCQSILDINNINLYHDNSSTGEIYISEENQKKLLEYYHDDYKLYLAYKNIPIEKRLTINTLKI